MSMSVSKEELLHTLAVFRENNHNQTATAAALNLSRSGLQNRLRLISEQGLDGSTLFASPVGQELSGVSTLYDADGNVKAQWVKSKAEVLSRTEIVDDLKAAFELWTPQAPKVESATTVPLEECATIYIIADQHLGMYSWKDETGADYDTELASQALYSSMLKLVNQTPSSKVGIILNLGDFFHSDSDENRTRRSGAVLDVDTRYARVLKAGVNLMVNAINLAKSRHKHVIVRCVPGNHDPYANIALTLALEAFYRKDSSVYVDTSPDPFWWFHFGNVFIGATHGDMVKAVDTPGIMAAFRPVEWGLSKFRYFYLGHVHHKSVGGGEKAGATWETFRTLAPKDAWHHSAGYASGQSMIAITHDKRFGEIMRHTVNIVPEHAHGTSKRSPS